MPRRRRFTPLKSKPRVSDNQKANEIDQEVSTARGRLKGALKEIMEPSVNPEESDHSSTHYKRDRKSSSDSSSDEDEKKQVLPQCYVLKLFDRKVDLSQFTEDTPLYPICRAWIINQPKAVYKKVSILNYKNTNEEIMTNRIELPGPEGPVVSRVPELIPEQLAVDKNNINLVYDKTLPTKEQLLSTNLRRWCKVRQSWQDQAKLVHQRYAATQEVLYKINVTGL